MFYNQIQPLMQSASNQNQHRANSSTKDAWKVVGFLGSPTRKGFALPAAALGTWCLWLHHAQGSAKLLSPITGGRMAKAQHPGVQPQQGPVPAPQAGTQSRHQLHPSLLPAGISSSREDGDASRTRLLYQHLISSPMPPRGQQQFCCRESRGFRAQGCCPAPAVAQRWPFPSRAALPPQNSHALHFSGLTHHRNQMPCPVINPAENLLTR